MGKRAKKTGERLSNYLFIEEESLKSNWHTMRYMLPMFHYWMNVHSFACCLKSCYEDETLNVSKGNFEKPKNLSIEVDCDKYQQDNPDGDNDTPTEDVPDELDL